MWFLFNTSTTRYATVCKFMYACVIVCVCQRERFKGREGERKREKERERERLGERKRERGSERMRKRDSEKRETRGERGKRETKRGMRTSLPGA